MKSLLDTFTKKKGYQGFGLIGHEARNAVVDQCFNEVIEELELSKDQAFLVANSTYGRFLGDEIEGKRSASVIKKIMAKRIKSALPKLEDEGKEEYETLED